MRKIHACTNADLPLNRHKALPGKARNDGRLNPRRENNPGSRRHFPAATIPVRCVRALPLARPCAGHDASENAAAHRPGLPSLERGSAPDGKRGATGVRVNDCRLPADFYRRPWKAGPFRVSFSRREAAMPPVRADGSRRASVSARYSCPGERGRDRRTMRCPRHWMPFRR